MTLYEQHVAARSATKTVSALTTNVAAVLALCSINGVVNQDRSIEVRFPHAVAPTIDASRAKHDIDALLTHEIFSLVEWLVVSQVDLDRESKAALYQDRWAQYI